MRRCPTCEEEIEEHLEVCPWCGRKTGFQPAEKSRLWNKRKLLGAVLLALVVVVALVIGLVAGCGKNRSGFGSGGSQLPIPEALDSFVAVMPRGSKVIARFHDERHCLYYLNSGHLMKFNAVSKMLDEVNPNLLTDNIHVYYNDRDDISGILEAELMPDEKFIYIKAVIDRQDKNDTSYKTISYKLNTESMNLVTTDYVPKRGGTAVTDSVKPSSRRRYDNVPKSEETAPTEPVEMNAVPTETPLEEQPSEPQAPSAPVETVVN